MLSGRHMELVTYNDKLYRVYRKINKDRIKDGHILDVRDAWHCDIVLKSKTQDTDTLLFLIEIPDAEIIEETPTPTPAATAENQN